jgi:PTS system mannose-specific IIA component
VSHGGLAAELLGAARVIVGDLPGLEALSLEWSTDQEIARQAIRECLEDLDEGHGVLLLTDLFGATPCNAACSVLEPGRFELVAGVNLPMVVRLACCPPDIDNVTELGEWLRSKGVESIRHITGQPEVVGS